MNCRELIEILVEALDHPRNRMGKLTPRDVISGERLRVLAVTLGVGGAEDRIDQAVKVMRAYLVSHND